MAILFFIVGALCLANGVLSIAEEKSVIHQIYVAEYVVGGFLLMGLGGVIDSIATGKKTAKAQLESTKALLMELQLLRASREGTAAVAREQGETTNRRLENANKWHERADTLLETIEKNTHPTA